jgi:hypothetical protein
LPGARYSLAHLPHEHERHGDGVTGVPAGIERWSSLTMMV